MNGTDRGRFPALPGPVYRGAGAPQAPPARQPLSRFFAANRQLLLFTLLFVIGTLLGIVVYALSHTVVGEELRTMLEVRAVPSTFRSGMSALFSSCFSTILLLAVLFLCGLSACGAPFACLVPIFFGLGLGMSEAYYYSTGTAGIAVVALLVAPHTLIAAAALVLGSMESVRMSLLFSRQILPGASIGGLWGDFKLYSVRFLLFLGLAFFAGVVDVGMRLLFSRLFQG